MEETLPTFVFFESPTRHKEETLLTFVIFESPTLQNDGAFGKKFENVDQSRFELGSPQFSMPNPDKNIEKGNKSRFEPGFPQFSIPNLNKNSKKRQ